MERGRLALLLLPPPPHILSPTDTEAAYGAALDATLKHIYHTENVRLDIAITLPPAWLQGPEVSRTRLFEKAQKALSHTYSLLCVAAANHEKELDCFGGVDARAFFLLPSREPAKELRSRAGDEKAFSGPVIDLATLVDSQRPYATIFGVESEEGETLLKSFLILYKSKHGHVPSCRRVPSALSILKPSDASERTPASGKSHTTVAVGGTFDHLHIGHKLLLTATALLAQPKGSQMNPSQTVHLTIGVSGDELLTKKKFAEQMESWDERQQKVATFLESIVVFTSPCKLSRKVERISKPDPNGKHVRVTFNSTITIDYVEILDHFGPTITDENISALVVSQETRSGGKAVNEKRQEKGWPPLEVLEIDVLEVNPGDDEQEDSLPATAALESKISSTEIRRRIFERRNSGE